VISTLTDDIPSWPKNVLDEMFIEEQNRLEMLSFPIYFVHEPVNAFISSPDSSEITFVEVSELFLTLDGDSVASAKRSAISASLEESNAHSAACCFPLPSQLHVSSFFTESLLIER
jgi:hypothetical protein